MIVEDCECHKNIVQSFEFLLDGKSVESWLGHNIHVNSLNMNWTKRIFRACITRSKIRTTSGEYCMVNLCWYHSSDMATWPSQKIPMRKSILSGRSWALKDLLVFYLHNSQKTPWENGCFQEDREHSKTCLFST